MKNYRIFRHAIVWAALCLNFGCWEDEQKITGMSYQETLITIYIFPHSFQVCAIEGTASSAPTYSVEWNTDVWWNTEPYEKVSRSSDPERYRYFCEKYGDTHYNQVNMPHWAMGHEFRSITLTCDRDFDADHPAGTPLNDIAEYFAASALPYIQSGYDEQAVPEPDPVAEEMVGCYLPMEYPVGGRLDQIDFGQMVLLSPNRGRLRLTRRPETAGEYTFTLTFKCYAGSHSATFSSVFDRPA